MSEFLEPPEDADETGKPLVAEQIKALQSHARRSGYWALSSLGLVEGLRVLQLTAPTQLLHDIGEKGVLCFGIMTAVAFGMALSDNHAAQQLSDDPNWRA